MPKFDFFTPTFQSYLSGEQFSEDATVSFPSREVLNRDAYLVQIATAKRVLHIGCVDHLEIIEDKIRSGGWLHKKLCDVAARCVGIDLNAKGIEYLASIGYDDVISGDLNGSEILPKVASDHFDYAIFGEVLEHVDNPVAFLGDFRALYKDVVDRVVVTVPNAFRHNNVKALLFSDEVINTDHRYWFTPFTIAKVATRAGLVVEDVFMTTFSTHSLWRRILFRWFPLVADDIVCVCTVPKT